MFRDDFVPQGGFEEWSESIWWRRALQLVSWEKYVRHYAHNGVYKSRGFFGGHITCEELTRMLPTYDRAVLYDGGARYALSLAEADAKAASQLIVQLFGIVEKDFLDFLSRDNVLETYTPSKPCAHVISRVLFPYQVYLFSQTEGDFSCLRTESIILEFYLLQLFPLCVRIITKSLTRILEKDVIPEVMSSLFETPLGQLLPYALSCLYIHNYSTYIGEHLSSEVEDLALLWCKLLTICRTEVLLSPCPQL